MTRKNFFQAIVAALCAPFAAKVALAHTKEQPKPMSVAKFEYKPPPFSRSRKGFTWAASFNEKFDVGHKFLSGDTESVVTRVDDQIKQGRDTIYIYEVVVVSGK